MYSNISNNSQFGLKHWMLGKSYKIYLFQNYLNTKTVHSNAMVLSSINIVAQGDRQ